ncbi:hypothetical protein HYH02_003883 [Chlamydomonas schloesseri]|uniref:Galactose oxidase n=1 Tax=Chlamydomonas schloesseri TaxID=2026947 RepID=A0A835WPU8_9CHLO|nr:hypothetical protein HYH02_003883 [Chlamydomonas schloesseri]|eukprot:KAG2451277.1 hypothetical protein HYH02_003883 [Chlamydomonas schloesseri]
MTWSLIKPEGLAPAPRGACCCVALGTQVLVFGGADRVPVSFSDLWVLETEGGKYEWTRITPVYAPGCKVMPRSGATMTAVGDKLYLFGGTEPVSNVCFNDIKVLDPKTWTWSDVEVTGTRPPERHSHCTGCLADTCLLVYGGAGYQGPMNDVWIFNTLQGGWTRPTLSGEQPPGREMHTGVMVDSTTLLIYGGRGPEFKVLCDAALFDAKQMKWTAVEPTPFSRCAHSAVVMPGAPASTSAAATAGAGAAGSGSAEPGASGSAGESGEAAAASGSGADCRVLIYGGYSGEAVEGDVLQIDPRSLEIELVRRGPRESDKGGTVPDTRFAHSAVVVPVPVPAAAGPSGSSAAAPAGGSHAMVVFGGVNPGEDLNDVAVWAE